MFVSYMPWTGCNRYNSHYFWLGPSPNIHRLLLTLYLVYRVRFQSERQMYCGVSYAIGFHPSFDFFVHQLLHKELYIGITLHSLYFSIYIKASAEDSKSSSFRITFTYAVCDITFFYFYSYTRWIGCNRYEFRYFSGANADKNQLLLTAFSSPTVLPTQTAYVLCFFTCHRISTSWLIILASQKNYFLKPCEANRWKITL